MKKRSVVAAIFQVLVAVIGTLGAVATAYMFVGNISLLSDQEAGLGVLGILILIPVQVILSIIPLTFGFVGAIAAIIQRRRPEAKDKFSLTMLIMGIVQFLEPFILFAALVITSNLMSA